MDPYLEYELEKKYPQHMRTARRLKVLGRVSLFLIAAVAIYLWMDAGAR